MKSQVIQGLDKLQKRLKDQDFITPPTKIFLREWKEDLKREAIDRAPGSGSIASAIRGAQDSARFPLWARVFMDEPKARWSEFGTGMLSEDPDSAHERYFPNIERLRDWSEARGRDPYSVALRIYHQGGTFPTHWFSLAAEAADARLNARIASFAAGIEKQAGIIT